MRAHMPLFFEQFTGAEGDHFEGADRAPFADNLAHLLFDDMSVNGMRKMELVKKAYVSLSPAQEFNSGNNS